MSTVRTLTDIVDAYDRYMLPNGAGGDMEECWSALKEAIEKGRRQVDEAVACIYCGRVQTHRVCGSCFMKPAYDLMRQERDNVSDPPDTSWTRDQDVVKRST